MGELDTDATSDRILDIAERLVQTQGFNAFSYAHIAGELGVTKASLHYHFPTKGALGSRLISRYSQRFLAALAALDAKRASPPRRLRAYAQLYEDVLRQNRMCLCGVLAADHATLPAPMRNQLKDFFDANEAWLIAVLTEGRKSNELEFSGPPKEHAQLLLGALEGAMLVARSYADVGRFTASVNRLLASFDSKEEPRARPPARARSKR